MKFGQVFNALRALGLDPAQVDEVLITTTSEALYVIVKDLKGQTTTHRVEER